METPFFRHSSREGLAGPMRHVYRGVTEWLRLPESVLDQISPQFHRARNYLDGLERNGLADGARRLRANPT